MYYLTIFSSMVQHFCANNLSAYVSKISKSGFIIAGHIYWGEGEAGGAEKDAYVWDFYWVLYLRTYIPAGLRYCGRSNEILWHFAFYLITKVLFIY